MGKTLTSEAGRMNDTKYRLRRDVFTSLTRQRGVMTRAAQAELTGVPRSSFFRILDGHPPSLANAMRMSEALSVPLDALFERVKE